jgi:hypothetical protein
MDSVSHNRMAFAVQLRTLLIPGLAQALCPGKGDWMLRQDKRRKSSGVRRGAFIIRHL